MTQYWFAGQFPPQDVESNETVRHTFVTQKPFVQSLAAWHPFAIGGTEASTHSPLH